MRIILLFCFSAFLFAGCAGPYATVNGPYATVNGPYATVNGPFTTYTHGIFTKNDTGETGLYIEGENWYALMNIPGFEDEKKMIFVRPSQFMYRRNKEGIIISAFAEKTEDFKDQKTCMNYRNYIPVEYKKNLNGKPVGVYDGKGLRRSIYYRPYYNGYCFNFHFSMDPSQGNEEKVSKVIDSIKFVPGGFSNALIRKLVYIGDKRLSISLPGTWKLSYDNEKLPTIVLSPEKGNAFKIAVSPVAGFGPKSVSLEEVKAASEKFMNRATEFAVEPPILKELVTGDAKIFYFDAADKHHKKDDTNDYPFLRQGHALINGMVFYFSIFYREAGKSDASIGLDMLANAYVLNLRKETLSNKDLVMLPATGSEPVRSTQQLKEVVDKLLSSGDSVMIRRDIKNVFTLIDKLIESNNNQEALAYLAIALKHDPWNMNYQILYAETLHKTGKIEQARQIANLVMDYAEKDDLINRVRKLRKEEPLPPLPNLSGLDMSGTSIVLVALGNVDTYFLRELRDRLQEILTVPVYLYKSQVSLPPSKRDPFRQQIDSLRKYYSELITKDPGFSRFLMANNISVHDFEKDSVVLDVARKLSYLSGGKDELIRIDDLLKKAAVEDKQWDIDDLLKLVKVAADPYRNERSYFLGIANLDAFADKSNYIFGTAENNGNHAVITYRRFSADFNHENHSRKRLVERTLKQSLSSIGFMLGVMRCSTPTCARAYPHSLAEHDAKSTELCETCKAGFSRALRFNNKENRAYINRGVELGKKGHHEEAIAEFNKVIDSDPTSAEAFNNKGYSLQQMGKTKEAIDNYNRAIELDPKLGIAYINRGNSYRALSCESVSCDINDNIRKAIQDYDKAFAMNLGNAVGYYYRGFLHYKLGNYDKQMEDFKEAARRGHKDAQNYLKGLGVSW